MFCWKKYAKKGDDKINIHCWNRCLTKWKPFHLIISHIRPLNTITWHDTPYSNQWCYELSNYWLIVMFISLKTFMTTICMFVGFAMYLPSTNTKSCCMFVLTLLVGFYFAIFLYIFSIIIIIIFWGHVNPLYKFNHIRYHIYNFQQIIYTYMNCKRSIYVRVIISYKLLYLV